MATVKIIEISGSSNTSWEDAVRSAVRDAAKSIKGLICVDVLGWTANIGDDGELTEYRADCKVAFKVES